MGSRDWRSIGLVTFVGATAFLLGSLVVSYFLTGSFRVAGAIAVSGAVSFGLVYLVVHFRSRRHQGK